MNILKFVTWLNKTRGWHIEGSYYAAIDEWRAWWRGEYSPFHTVKEAGLDDVIHERPMYRLRMPKRACEDWASLLLNDKTTVTAQDKSTADWLLGPDGRTKPACPRRQQPKPFRFSSARRPSRSPRAAFAAP